MATKEQETPVEMTDDKAPEMEGHVSDSNDKSDPAEIRAELERTRKALQSANKEAKDRRLRLEELEKAEQDRKESQLSESEKVRKQLAERETKARDLEKSVADLQTEIVNLKLDHAIEAEATRAGWEYPDLAPKVIDRSRIEIDQDTGKIAGIADAVAKYAKDRPGLVGRRSGGGTPPNMPPMQRGSVPQGTPDVKQQLKSDLLRTGRYPR